LAHASAEKRETDTGLVAMQGLSPAPQNTEQMEEHAHADGLTCHDFNRIIFIAAAAGAVWFVRGTLVPYMQALGIVCTFAGGYPIFREAYENLVHRRMTMELSMTIAIVAALAIGETFTALVITLFVLGAEILEGLTVGRGRQAIERLLDLLPNQATVRREGSWEDVRTTQIRAGDIVLVRPGARIPVDGAVVAGNSFVDEAAITGESFAVEKLPGMGVYAGTINQSGALELRVERLGRDTTFGKIIEQVEHAEKSRAPIQKIADRLSGYLVYFALAAAVLTFVITHNLRSTISVVIVAGACGIAAGTPLAILGAIGQAARNGAIVKGGVYLETLSRVDTVLLDKTGTLSYGSTEVLEVKPAAGVSSEHVLVTASIAEFRSEHPVAKAILKKTKQLDSPSFDPEGFSYTPGRGVLAKLGGEEIVVGSRLFLEEQGIGLLEWPADHGDGGSEVGVAREGRFLGAICVGDVLRPEASKAIAALKRMGLKTILLTGDARQVAESAAQALGVDEVAAELLPAQKVARVKELLEAGHTVAMVSDGINDAPALMQASVGVAMGSGTDVARESASIVLIGNDLSKLVETFRLARRCRGIILQNFAGTLIVDCVGMVLAGLGFLNPLLAAFIHVSSELAFISNSARLIPASRVSQAAAANQPL